MIFHSYVTVYQRVLVIIHHHIVMNVINVKIVIVFSYSVI